MRFQSAHPTPKAASPAAPADDTAALAAAQRKVRRGGDQRGAAPESASPKKKIDAVQSNAGATAIPVSSSADHAKLVEEAVKNCKAISADCAAQQTKFTDDDFPLIKALEGLDKFDAANVKFDGADVRYSRPDEIFGIPTVLAQRNGDAGVKQGSLGDCYFIGTIAALALKSPELLMNMIMYSDDKAGIYGIRMYHNSKMEIIVVDDLLPNIEGQSDVLFGRNFDKSQKIVSLLEKAYAKMCGSYAAIESGNMSTLMPDLLDSSVPLKMDTKGKSASYVFQYLTEKYQNGWLLSAATPSGSDQNLVDGLAQGHAYTITKVLKASSGEQLIQLQNPWHRGEWTGRFSDESNFWTEDLKKQAKHTVANDGIFWMDVEDFIGHFDSVDACSIGKGACH